MVFANSVQAELDNAVRPGQGARLADILRRALSERRAAASPTCCCPTCSASTGVPATTPSSRPSPTRWRPGGRPNVTGDREIELLHAQDAAAALIDAHRQRRDAQVGRRGEPIGSARSSTLFERVPRALRDARRDPDSRPTDAAQPLQHLSRRRLPGHVADLAAGARRRPRRPVRDRPRRTAAPGMAFVSTTLPGQKRGEHYHLHKVERFFVVQG